MSMKTFIEIKTDFEAIHNWPECPYEEVSFLKYPHRHKIYITVKIETTKDRQIEFFMLKREVDKIIGDLYGIKNPKELGRKSMEEISSDLIEELNYCLQYKNRPMEVSASEDGQVRGIVEYISEVKDKKEYKPDSNLSALF